MVQSVQGSESPAFPLATPPGDRPYTGPFGCPRVVVFPPMANTTGRGQINIEIIVQWRDSRVSNTALRLPPTDPTIKAEVTYPEHQTLAASLKAEPCGAGVTFKAFRATPVGL